MPSINTRAKAEKATTAHCEHIWSVFSRDEERCRRCTGIRISGEELQRRTDEWLNYYEWVKTTDSYRDFQEMRVASKGDSKGMGFTRKVVDRERIKKILERVETRCKLGEEKFVGRFLERTYEFDESKYGAKPGFPDPFRFRYETL